MFDGLHQRNVRRGERCISRLTAAVIVGPCATHTHSHALVYVSRLAVALAHSVAYYREMRTIQSLIKLYPRTAFVVTYWGHTCIAVSYARQ